MNEVRKTAKSTVQVENDWIIVTEWRFTPRAETTWHRHEHNYVVVPQTTGKLLIETHEGTVTSNLITGQSYARPKGIEHNVINPNDYEFIFVEIEIK